MVMRKVMWVALLGTALVAHEAAAQLGSAMGWYTIPMAAEKNDTDGVQQLLADTANDPNAVESTTGRTGLDFAAAFNNAAMAKMLLSHNAHVDLRDRSGNTAIAYAAERGSLLVLRILLDAKADPNAANRDGITPLMLAVDKSQPEAIRMLLAGGADPKKQDFTGRDAFGWAAGKPAIVEALKEGKP
ncbi:MAG TPA: ankyrin repeat domain-containing protein [Stellaceae bacterium]|nr:ankyrin repeat domain-containing protein [Stellaceae bacterium]